jgi:DNA repair exonuclease SbcCD ATPase subunit
MSNETPVLTKEQRERLTRIARNSMVGGDLQAVLAALTAAEQQVTELRRERADLGAQLYAQTERVKHLLDTIDVERTGRKEAEAARDVAREEAEKWRTAARVLCGAHVGVPQATCPVCDLAAAREETARLRGALEFYATHHSGYGATARAALTPTPPQPAARTEEG